MSKSKDKKTPIVGMQVYWYPRAVQDEDTVPMVGFITRGWSGNVATLSVLPVDDGAVMSKDQVYHSSDPRLRDGYGRLTEGARERGCWEYTPLSLSVLENDKKAKS